MIYVLLCPLVSFLFFTVNHSFPQVTLIDPSSFNITSSTPLLSSPLQSPEHTLSVRHQQGGGRGWQGQSCEDTRRHLQDPLFPPDFLFSFTHLQSVLPRAPHPSSFVCLFPCTPPSYHLSVSFTRSPSSSLPVHPSLSVPSSVSLSPSFRASLSAGSLSMRSIGWRPTQSMTLTVCSYRSN